MVVDFRMNVKREMEDWLEAGWNPAWWVVRIFGYLKLYSEENQGFTEGAGENREIAGEGISGGVQE